MKKFSAATAAVVLVSALLVGGGVSAYASDRSSPVRTEQNHALSADKAKRSLLGAWQAHITFDDNAPPSIPSGEEDSVQAFSSDGIMSTYATGGGTTAFGVWESTNKRGAFRYTFHELAVTPDGQYIGYVIVTASGTLSDDGRTYTAVGSGQFYTPDGTPAGPPSHTTTTAQRITF